MDRQKLPLSALLAACHGLNGGNYEKIEHMTLISFDMDCCLVKTELYNKLLWVYSSLLGTNVLFQTSITYSLDYLKRLVRIVTCEIGGDRKQVQGTAARGGREPRRAERDKMRLQRLAGTALLRRQLPVPKAEL